MREALTGHAGGGSGVAGVASGARAGAATTIRTAGVGGASRGARRSCKRARQHGKHTHVSDQQTGAMRGQASYGGIRVESVCCCRANTI